MKRLCAESGAQLVLLLVPAEAPVRWKSCWYFREVLTSFCKKEGIACMDLDRPECGGPFDPAECCYVYDGHWNRKGHDLAGREVAKVLAPMVKTKGRGKD